MPLLKWWLLVRNPRSTENTMRKSTRRSWRKVVEQWRNTRRRMRKQGIYCGDWQTASHTTRSNDDSKQKDLNRKSQRNKSRAVMDQGRHEQRIPGKAETRNEVLEQALVP